MLKQITVFIENKPGRLADVTACLADENINLHALSVADTTDFGILRIIVSDPDRAKKVLREKGYMVKAAEVAAVAMGNTPGCLSKVLRELETLNISIEYMYAFAGSYKGYDAIVIFRPDNLDAALLKLEGSSLTILDQDILDRLNEA